MGMGSGATKIHGMTRSSAAGVNPDEAGARQAAKWPAVSDRDGWTLVALGSTEDLATTNGERANRTMSYLRTERGQVHQNV